MNRSRIFVAALLAVLLVAVAPVAAATNWTSLPGVTTTGAGTSYPFANTPGAQAFIYSSAGSSATVIVQGAPTSSGPWETLATVSDPSATGTCVRGTSYPYLRANATARSSGTLYAILRDLREDPGAWGPCVATQSAAAPNFGVIKYTIANADVVALGASLTGDITIGTLPANSRVLATYVNVTSADTSANALTISLGTVATGYVDWVVASDGKSAALYGDATAERGATNLDGALFYSTATTIKSHFVKTTTNLSTVTAFTATVYVAYQTFN